MKKLISLIFVTILSAGSIFAQKAALVATVNMDLVLGGYVAYQTALERVEGTEQTAQEEVEAFKEKLGLLEVEGKVQELQQKSQNPAIADEERKLAMEEAQSLINQNEAKIQQLSAFGQQLQQRMQQARTRALSPFEFKAREAVNTVANDKSVDLVLPIVPRQINTQGEDGTETQYSLLAGQVMYASDALEITDAVIAVLNAE